MQDRWSKDPSSARDELDELVYLSNLLGEEVELVQPGGGNSSVKIQTQNPFGETELVLAVKGSGTDLRTIPREGFTQLSMHRLRALQQHSDMSDQAMMDFMQSCMLRAGRDPMPSVETPLHFMLPYNVIAHTHDVATMSLTNIDEQKSRELLHQLFDGRIFYVPYVRPGFPLAKAVMEAAGQIPQDAIGLALAHHGLVAWGDDSRQCYQRMIGIVDKMERFFGSQKSGKKIFGAALVHPKEQRERRKRAHLLLPVIRGFLSKQERVILHFDDSKPVLDAISAERFGELSQRGMVTPEHLLRAGRLPVPLKLDLDQDAASLAKTARTQLEAQHQKYLRYHGEHQNGETPIDDWAKVVLIPGLGMVTAFKDRNSARTANLCYRAAIKTIANAEAIGGFEFIADADVFEFEHWPLERRKTEEAIQKERKTLLLARRIALVVGGASGIGRGTAEQFVEAGAHVMIGDLDETRALELAEQLRSRYGAKVDAVALDVTEDRSIAAAVERTVLQFGGLDCLFYTVGAAPRFARIADIERPDLQKQLEVHYLGAVMAMKHAAAVMDRQGIGGSILCSVSKAALSPGKEAIAYGGSKAALQHALRIAAVEYGPLQIRVNALNADQIDTPLFRDFIKARAKTRGVDFDVQVENYRQRNAMGVSLIPAAVVGQLAVLAASDHFRYTTGDILTIDGGLPDAFPR